MFQKALNKLIKEQYPNASYIHIPKTGGTYIGQLESSDAPVISPIKYLGHSVVVNKKLDFPSNYPPQTGYKNKTRIDQNYLLSKYVVSTVRNIFDWLVSYWGHAGGIKTKYTDPSHYDFKLAQTGFKNFVNEVAKREGDNIWPSKKLIHFAIFSYHGDLMVDWINRTSSLDKDLKKMAILNNLKYQKKSMQRVGRKSRDYKNYYNQELINLVNITWGREQKLFGFDFEGYNPKKAILKNIITNKNKKEIKYFWETDTLLIGDKELK